LTLHEITDKHTHTQWRLHPSFKGRRPRHGITVSHFEQQLLLLHSFNGLCTRATRQFENCSWLCYFSLLLIITRQATVLRTKQSHEPT